MKIKKRRYKYRLRREVKRTALKIIISLIMIVADCVIYHYLGVLGHLMGENHLASIFIYVGWIWLLAGQFMAFYAMWE